MKKMLFALIALCAFVSCDKDKPIDYKDDIIVFSVDRLTPTAQSSEYELVTENDQWMHGDGVNIDGELYYLVSSNEINNLPDNMDINKFIVAEFGSFDGSGKPKEIVKFSYEWFTVTKVNLQTMRIELNSNYSSLNRQLSIAVYVGNERDQLDVIQRGVEVSNLRFSDVKFKGDQLTIAEAETLTQQIEADAYSGIQFYQEDKKIRFFSDEDAEQFIEYKYKSDPKEEDLTAEEAAVFSRISKMIEPIQIDAVCTLSNEDETTAMFVTREDIEVRSSPSPPTYFHIDVTDRYKGQYPELDIAIVTYRPY